MYIKKVLFYRINYNEIIGLITFISRYFNISSL